MRKRWRYKYRKLVVAQVESSFVWFSNFLVRNKPGEHMEAGAVLSVGESRFGGRTGTWQLSITVPRPPLAPQHSLSDLLHSASALEQTTTNNTLLSSFSCIVHHLHAFSIASILHGSPIACDLFHRDCQYPHPLVTPFVLQLVNRDTINNRIISCLLSGPSLRHLHVPYQIQILQDACRLRLTRCSRSRTDEEEQTVNG